MLCILLFTDFNLLYIFFWWLYHCMSNQKNRSGFISQSKLVIVTPLRKLKQMWQKFFFYYVPFNSPYILCRVRGKSGRHRRSGGFPWCRFCTVQPQCQLCMDHMGTTRSGHQHNLQLLPPGGRFMQIWLASGEEYYQMSLLPCRGDTVHVFYCLFRIFYTFLYFSSLWEVGPGSERFPMSRCNFS